HRHPRDAFAFRVADGQRFDVECPAPEQRGDTVQDARLVIDVHRKGMQHGLVFQSAAVSTIGDGRRIILCRSAPAGTIGYTESSCSTWKSMTAARFSRRAASTAPITSPRLVTVAAAMPNASASFAKFGPVRGVAA